jgi:hypothetical protein
MQEMPEMQDDELKRIRDEVRWDAALQTLKDVLWRFEEIGEGSYTMYDLLGTLTEDLVREGCCAACIRESVDAAFQQAGVDASEHIAEDDATFH